MESKLETLRSWLLGAPGLKERLLALRIDYTDQRGDNGGVFPTGLRELKRQYDLLGRVRLRCQLRAAVYLVLQKAPGDDRGGAENASLVLALQAWVQNQSLRGNAPLFGDEPENEWMTAQNGALYDTDDEGTATYKVELYAEFTKVKEE